MVINRHALKSDYVKSARLGWKLSWIQYVVWPRKLHCIGRDIDFIVSIAECLQRLHQRPWHVIFFVHGISAAEMRQRIKGEGLIVEVKLLRRFVREAMFEPFPVKSDFFGGDFVWDTGRATEARQAADQDQRCDERAQMSQR